MVNITEQKDLSTRGTGSLVAFLDMATPPGEFGPYISFLASFLDSCLVNYCTRVSSSLIGFCWKQQVNQLLRLQLAFVISYITGFHPIFSTLLMTDALKSRSSSFGIHAYLCMGGQNFYENNLNRLSTQSFLSSIHNFIQISN